MRKEQQTQQSRQSRVVRTVDATFTTRIGTVMEHLKKSLTR